MSRKLKIIPFENFYIQHNENKIYVDDVSITYGQLSDSSGEDGDELGQTLTVSSRNNGCARFINIKTNSWSFSDIEELEQIIKDFKRRALLTNKEKDNE